MEKLITLVKILILIQIVAIVLFILLFYFTKIYYYYRDKKAAKTADSIKEIFNLHLKNNQPLTDNEITILKKSVNDVLNRLSELEKTESQNEGFINLKSQVHELLLKPIARKWYSSRKWYKRFDAALSYSYGFDPQDENHLMKLLNDPSPLISINIVEISIRSNNQKLINAMITIFSTRRRLQQALVFETMARFTTNNISPLVFERLEHEEELYTIIFCYRLLSKFKQKKVIPRAKIDLTYDSNDLKIAVLNYLAHCEDDTVNELIYTMANDPHWEVVADVAKILGKVKTQEAVNILARLLCSREWWIRHNAAYSLYQCGEEGIKILQEQSADKDKFAYETAQAILIEKERA